MTPEQSIQLYVGQRPIRSIQLRGNHVHGPQRDFNLRGNEMVMKCKSLNASGDACQAIPLKGGDHCAWHDESLAEQRKQWSVAGGKNKSNSVRARKRLQRLELSEIDGALCLAMLYVLDGTLSPGVATAAATVARTIQQVRTATEHEQRIAELEALVLEGQKEQRA